MAKIIYNKIAIRREFFCEPHKKTSQTASGLQPTNWIRDLVCFVVSFQFKHTTCIISESLRKVLMILGSDFPPSPQSPGQRDKQNFKQASVIASVNIRSHTGLPIYEALRQEIRSVSHISITLVLGDTVQQTLS